MIKLHNVLLACALGAGTVLGAATPASAHGYVRAARPAVAARTGRVAPGYPNSYGYRYPSRYGYRYPSRYGYGYGYPYRYGYGAGYGYPYGVSVGVGYGYPYGVGVGVGYGYVGGGYAYRPYAGAYWRRGYRVRRAYRPYYR